MRAFAKISREESAPRVRVSRPLPRPQLTVRLSANRYGLDRVGTYINSQFFVSIFNLAKKLALLHIVMVAKGAQTCLYPTG